MDWWQVWTGCQCRWKFWVCIQGEGEVPPWLVLRKPSPDPVVWLLSHVWIFEVPWTAARRASLTVTIFLSLLKSMLSWCCHPPISSSVQSFPASGSFPVNQLLASGGQSIGASASSSVLPMNIQGWFCLGLTALLSLSCWEIYTRHCS